MDGEKRVIGGNSGAEVVSVSDKLIKTVQELVTKMMALSVNEIISPFYSIFDKS